jgi:hypothetical protein
MNDMVPMPRSRGRLAVSALVTGAAFAAGMTVVGSSQAAHMTGAIAGLAVVGAGLSQLVGEIWPRRQRWVLYASWTAVAGALGILARAVVHAISLYVPS